MEKWVERNPLGLDPLEISGWYPIGKESAATPPKVIPTNPLDAFEESILAGLRRPPCVVLFSGGRDSSAVLAVAARLARHHGLPQPLPVSVRMPRDPNAEESQWQELVIRHADITDWLRLTVDYELDLVGRRAQRIVREHGLLWPPYLTLHELGMEHAQGGSLLIGLHGDGVLVQHEGRQALRDVVFRRRRPGRRDVLRLGLALAPTRLRTFVLARRSNPEIPGWLTAEGAAEVHKREARLLAESRLWWDANVRTVLTRRTFALALRGLAILGEDHDCRVIDPFADAAFVHALANRYGKAGNAGRTAFMHDLFADDLPPAMIARPDKARFRHCYFGPESRSFAQLWDGRGLPAVVDPEKIRAAWLQVTDPEQPSPVGTRGLGLPLQAAWLATNT